MSVRIRLVEQLASVEPVDEREEQSLRLTLARLQESDDPFDETLNLCHVTSSAFVLSSRGVILHLHKRLKIWVQPGGHVDEGESPEEAAVRETWEETGLRVIHTDPPTLFHVDVHPGPRGHTHYDLRYLLLSSPLDPSPMVGESPDVHWFEFERASERCEVAMRPALAKLELAASQWQMRD